MMDKDPRLLLGIGFVLLLVGFALPALMILAMLKSTFFLNFLSYAASFVGLVLGFIGSVLYVGRHRKK